MVNKMLTLLFSLTLKIPMMVERKRGGAMMKTLRDPRKILMMTDLKNVEGHGFIKTLFVGLLTLRFGALSRVTRSLLHLCRG